MRTELTVIIMTLCDGLREDSHFVVECGKMRVIATILLLSTPGAAPGHPLLYRIPYKLNASHDCYDQVVDLFEDPHDALKDEHEDR